MLVVGKHAYIIAETGKKVDVSPFTPDYKPLTVPLVDATVKYNNPYDGKTYILVLCNALYVPSMDHNLIPPFMLWEMGVTVNDVPKIHKEDPTVDDNTITFAETRFRIPLSLWGIFSYFPTSKPTHDDLLNPNEVYILSPATWNPHSDAYSANEESMLDWEGNMQPKKDRQHRIVLDDVEDNVTMVSSLSITLLEQEAIDVEKPQFPIVFNFSCALFKSKTTCLHVSFTTYEYFYKLSKSASFYRWLLHPVIQKNQ